MSATSGVPEVAVLVPAYRSQDTIGAFLDGLSRQTFRDFEVVVVDSSPDEATAEMVRVRAPWARLVRPGGRLLPQEARSRAVAEARSQLLVFTDPDVEPAPDWLERLVAAHRRTGALVTGAIACRGDRWLHLGMHLCKFAKWLPGLPPGPVDVGPTANLLCPAAEFARLGGFTGDPYLGDAVLSWQARRHGPGLVLDATAVVAHQHEGTLGSFVRERWTRGIRYGRMRTAWEGGGRWRSLGYLLATVLPLRFVRVLALTARHSARAGQLGAYAATLPVVAVGHAAALAGEALAHLRDLLRPRPQAVSSSASTRSR